MEGSLFVTQDFYLVPMEKHHDIS